MIRDRERTAALWGFDFRLEIYVPKARRRHGFFVMPVLQDGELVGRIDPRFDRARGALVVEAVHPEPGRRFDRDALEGALHELARWLGAERVELPA